MFQRDRYIKKANCNLILLGPGEYQTGGVSIFVPVKATEAIQAERRVERCAKRQTKRRTVNGERRQANGDRRTATGERRICHGSSSNGLDEWRCDSRSIEALPSSSFQRNGRTTKQFEYLRTDRRSLRRSLRRSPHRSVGLAWSLYLKDVSLPLPTDKKIAYFMRNLPYFSMCTIWRFHPALEKQFALELPGKRKKKENRFFIDDRVVFELL